ncbi:MAG: hypothetical protein ACRYF0_04690 [Janthinobacterium lividum]
MKASLLLLGATLLYTRTPERPTVVQGVFINKASVDKAKQLDWLLLQVKLKVGRTVIAQSTVQPDGHYIISNQSNAKADLVYCGVGVNDDVYLATVLPHQSDTVKLTSELPISILKKHGTINCPKCKQKNKVLPIDGRAGVVMQTSDGQRQPYDKKHYYSDSDVSGWLDPHWYCVRDTIKF